MFHTLAAATSDLCQRVHSRFLGIVPAHPFPDSAADRLPHRPHSPPLTGPHGVPIRHGVAPGHPDPSGAWPPPHALDPPGPGSAAGRHAAPSPPPAPPRPTAAADPRPPPPPHRPAPPRNVPGPGRRGRSMGQGCGGLGRERLPSLPPLRNPGPRLHPRSIPPIPSPSPSSTSIRPAAPDRRTVFDGCLA